MKVLVSGSNGFLGRHVIRYLLNAGYEVVGCDLTSTGLILDKYEEVKGNLKDEELYTELKGKGISGIIHCAIITSPALTDEEAFNKVLDVNVNILLKLLKFATENNIEHFINVSSASVYGDRLEPMLKETMTTKPLDTYAVSKTITEMIVSHYRKVYKIKAISARIATPYGEYERNTGVRTVLSPIYQMMRDAKNGDISCIYHSYLKRDWTYADDTAGAIESLLSTPNEKLTEDVYNVSAVTEYSLIDVAKTIQQLIPKYRYESTDNIEKASVVLRPDRARGYLDNQILVESTGYQFKYSLYEGLQRVYNYIK